ncbi:MAG: histidinol dehydrogenase [Marinifilaceae bacterium]
MQTLIKPNRQTWETLAQRPIIDYAQLETLCREVFNDIRKDGDNALKSYEQLYDKVTLESLRVEQQLLDEAGNTLSPNLKTAINVAYSRIAAFHSAQLTQVEAETDIEGVRCWQERRPIEKVGLYIPGGTAPLFSTVLMLGIPAQLAGCSDVVLCTPPNAEGKVPEAVLYCAKLCGITQIFTLGGIQAIGAMTIGTESVPRVYKLFGPGNQYVTAAKRVAQQIGVAIDMPAGPSEVMVVADKTADARFVAADLLSQAEHGKDSQVMLVTDYAPLLEQVNAEVQAQLNLLPRREMVEATLQNSKLILVENMEEAMDLANYYAAEHLILSLDNPQMWAGRVVNAGSVFLGHYSPESVGDYASGTNHTLPTAGFSAMYSGVNMDAYTKKITFQQLTREGLQKLAPTVTAMAITEQLDAHARAVTIRLENK